MGINGTICNLYSRIDKYYFKNKYTNMNILKEFNQIKELINEAEEKILKGVSMNKKRPVVEGRRMFRTVRQKMDAIGKFSHEKVNNEVERK